ncbi:MAG: glutamate-1-semialdehyde 2,1-aminomutase [Candidatus Omnitrophota bacterium]|nr:glutamate-1-semialdehyde 2,1-aminomutase [Candidatus Omnitrophota bacterium]
MAKRTINSELFAEARKYLAGGVNSPVRAFNYAGCDPMIIKKGLGSKVYDYDGKVYIDYVLSWGSLILGHAHPGVIRGIKKVIKSGLSFGATNRLEIELAKIILKAIPSIAKIRFVNSGTEAVMGAVRLARGYTKRDKILKFECSYHGHADYLLVKSGSGLATFGLPASAGVPRNYIKDTLMAGYGDKKAVENIFKKHRNEIAAVIFEPCGGNYGVISPDIDFLKYLRAVTAKNRALLIADEVITGFRFDFGSLSRKLGITPDIISLGKIIGGGLPIGAYGARQEIMNHLAPLGEVYQASTFAGNPVVMQSGLSTLRELEKLKDKYSSLGELTEYLSESVRESARASNIELDVENFGSMFSLRFKEKKQFQRFYGRLLESGVYFAQSEFETNFLSFSHTRADIEKTIRGVKRALDAA